MCRLYLTQRIRYSIATAEVICDKFHAHTLRHVRICQFVPICFVKNLSLIFGMLCKLLLQGQFCVLLNVKSKNYVFNISTQEQFRSISFETVHIPYSHNSQSFITHNHFNSMQHNYLTLAKTTCQLTNTLR